MNIYDAIVEIGIYATAFLVLGGAYFIFEWARFIGGNIIEERRKARGKM